MSSPLERLKRSSFALWLRAIVVRAGTVPVVRIAVEVQRRFRADHGRAFSGAMTYRAFLALFPLALLGLSVIGYVIDDVGARARWVERVASAVPGADAIVSDVLHALVRDRAAIGVVAFLGLVWTGTGIIRVTGNALDVIHRVPPFSGLRMIRWALLSLASLGALSLISFALAGAAGRLAAGSAGRVITLLAMFVVDSAMFLVAYRILTHRPGPPFAHLWPGALFSAAGWALLKIGGAWLASRSVSSAEAVYGAFASTIGVLLLLSVTSRLFLYGAELNAVLVERTRDEAGRLEGLPPLPRRMAG